MTFTLEELKNTIKVFSSHQCDFLTDNCIVALELNNHKTGSKMQIMGDQEDEVLLLWSTKVETAGYKEQKKITEHAAEAISFFLAKELTEYSVIEEATIGTGFDYWLGFHSAHSKYDPLNFLSARLEISGILKETSHNSVEARVRDKKDQTKPTDYLKLPAYISIIEFSKPKAYFALK